jgi:hypothetical protein
MVVSPLFGVHPLGYINCFLGQYFCIDRFFSLLGLLLLFNCLCSLSGIFTRSGLPMYTRFVYTELIPIKKQTRTLWLSPGLLRADVPTFLYLLMLILKKAIN